MRFLKIRQVIPLLSIKKRGKEFMLVFTPYMLEFSSDMLGSGADMLVFHN
ncbi:hypothetical protein GCM10009001_03060 [Virgibacillus siamensis]|uniref:Uncharacterized protein n=1 Tax=Virgibacillus siamensis TaxID=480071 RepID=A0ABP3QGT1_9BACI